MIWIMIALVCFVMEILTYGFVFICFSFGAIITLLFLKYNTIVQLTVFLVTSILSLILLRKVSNDFIKYSKELDRITEKEVIIEEFLFRGNEKIYTVKLDGKYWESICSEELNIGDRAIVLSISGNKLILKRN